MPEKWVAIIPGEKDKRCRGKKPARRAQRLGLGDDELARRGCSVGIPFSSAVITDMGTADRERCLPPEEEAARAPLPFSFKLCPRRAERRAGFFVSLGKLQIELVQRLVCR